MREDQKIEVDAEEELPAAEAAAAAEGVKIEEKGGKMEFQKESTVKEISAVNPIADFKSMVSDRKVDRVADALGQMKRIIFRFVRNSLAGNLYEKALECLVEMRETSVSEDEAVAFNEFM